MAADDAPQVDPDDLRDRPERWPVVDTRDIHRDAWVVAMREDTVHRPGHPEETFPRLSVEHAGAVMVLAVDDAERVCCIRQYRHAAGGSFVEIPAGLRDSDEDEAPVDTAKRELREEAELRAEEWTQLLSTFPSAGITSERHEIFLARGLSHWDRGDFEMHAEEAELEKFWVPFEALLEAVLDGRVAEAPLVNAVLCYDALKRRGRL